MDKKYRHRLKTCVLGGALRSLGWDDSGWGALCPRGTCVLPETATFSVGNQPRYWFRGEMDESLSSFEPELETLVPGDGKKPVTCESFPCGRRGKVSQHR